MTDLNGKTALITGATSGIGRATALALAARGARVLVTGRNEQRASDLTAEIEGSVKLTLPAISSLSRDVPLCCTVGVLRRPRAHGGRGRALGPVGVTVGCHGQAALMACSGLTRVADQMAGGWSCAVWLAMR